MEGRHGYGVATMFASVQCPVSTMQKYVLSPEPPVARVEDFIGQPAVEGRRLSRCLVRSPEMGVMAWDSVGCRCPSDLLNGAALIRECRYRVRTTR
jgi:hypothetical protein